jgi:hypothetical protein
MAAAQGPDAYSHGFRRQFGVVVRKAGHLNRDVNTGRPIAMMFTQIMESASRDAEE